MATSKRLKSFEIDATFKRVQGVIKEWEINAFVERYNKSNSKFDYFLMVAIIDCIDY